MDVLRDILFENTEFSSVRSVVSYFLPFFHDTFDSIARDSGNPTLIKIIFMPCKHEMVAVSITIAGLL